MLIKVLKFTILLLVIIWSYAYVYNSGKSFAYSRLRMIDSCICETTVYNRLVLTLTPVQKELLLEMMNQDCAPLIKKKV